MEQQYISRLVFNNSFYEAQKIDQPNDQTVYYGYCSRDCTGIYDPHWCIKRLTIAGNEQTVEFANGELKFNQAWSDRASLTYKITPLA